MRPRVGRWSSSLLFLAMLRIGPGRTADRAQRGLGAGRDAALRCCNAPCPRAWPSPLAPSGFCHGDFALGALLILAAAPITGAAHIAVMAGGDPAPALRLTVIGTALLPLTVVPVFALAPAFGDARPTSSRRSFGCLR
jgi:ACR3 family arsenite transporter